MLIYICIVIFIIVGINSRKRRAYSDADPYFWLLCFLLICVSGFRSISLANDTPSYYEDFIYLPSFSELDYDFLKSIIGGRMQPLWLLFNAICKRISPDFQFFMFVHAAIVNIVLFKVFSRYPAYKYQLLLIFVLKDFWYFEWDILREVLSVCMFVLAFPLYERKKYIKFYICCTVCFLFHVSGIICFIIPSLISLLNKFSKSRHFLLSILIVFVSAFIFSIKFGEILNIVSLVSSEMAGQGEFYASLEANSNTLIYTAIQVFMLSVLIYVRRESGMDNNLTSYVILYALLAIINLKVPLFGRFQNYIFLFYYLSLIDTYYKLPVKRTYKILFSGVVAFLIVSQLYYYFRPVSYGHFIDAYVPYKTWLFM